jgi:hypothetical protein
MLMQSAAVYKIMGQTEQAQQAPLATSMEVMVAVLQVAAVAILAEQNKIPATEQQVAAVIIPQDWLVQQLLTAVPQVALLVAQLFRPYLLGTQALTEKVVTVLQLEQAV